MSEETQVVIPEVTANPFTSWSDTPPEPVVTPEPEQKTETPAATEKQQIETPAAETKEEEEILEPKEWLKREFGVDDPAEIRAQKEELEKLRGLKPEELKFADEQSKTIHELLREGKRKEVKEFLDTQDKLETFLTAEVNNDTAANMIKLGMQLKYKDLTPAEIDYKFNKDFGIPREPVRKDDDLEGEYEARRADWEEQVRDIQQARIIEAKLVKPELEKAKANLVLPELTKPAAAETVSQPDPAQLQAIRESFLSALESNYSKFEGFETKVKDELVEIPVAFKVPDEEKLAIKERLQEGMDVNEYIDKRWFDEKGTPKIEQIISDIYRLENLEKILSGVANNAANLRLTEFQKSAKNIDLNGKTAQQTFQQPNGQQGVNPFSQNAWSEKPPVFST